MSAVLPAPSLATATTPWLPALLGFAAMYVPSYWVAAHGVWQSEDFGHAPIILAVVLWLFWQARERIVLAADCPMPLLGWSSLGLGLLLYAVGRTFSVTSIEFLSQPLVVAAAVLLLKGMPGMRAVWFAIAYMIFMVPLPSTLVDAMTGPLKQWVSLIVVELLHGAGYPIARTGVMITIGPYQLLVADACSGLNSMVSLSAIGVLFMHVVSRKGHWHNALLLVSILPIAFAVNVVRVLTLSLVTYHLGDEAAQGFLHDATGVVTILAALVGLFALDGALRVVLPMLGAVRHSRPL